MIFFLLNFVNNTQTKKQSELNQIVQRVDKTVYTLADFEKLAQILRKEIRRRTLVR